nr:MAG TPA_asm: hypothetical protein [Bacteriophage sp.]
MTYFKLYGIIYFIYIPLLTGERETEVSFFFYYNKNT